MVVILVFYWFVTTYLSETHIYDNGTNHWYVDMTARVDHVATLNGNNIIKRE